MEEPSVLDYLKAKLTPWRGPAPRIPPADPAGLPIPAAEAASTQDQGSTWAASEAAAPGAGIAPLAQETGTQATARPVATVTAWPWLSLLAFGLAFVAQTSLEPRPGRSWLFGAFFYILSFFTLALASLRGEWLPAALPEPERKIDPLTVRLPALSFGIVFALLAFLAFGNNRFTPGLWDLLGFQSNKFTLLNITLWLLALISVIWSFWLPDRSFQSRLVNIKSFLTRREWDIRISRWALLLLVVAGLVLFFRVYRLEQVPPEMVSDQAEKLQDVWDVLHGETRIFFPRNTGREALQMYLTAAIIQVFGTGYSFLSLKIGTVLAGLLTLPFMYFLGKEVGNRRIGILAVAFAGIAYWPNMISRIGLRFPLSPLFVAPTLYYLLRGIRKSNRNDFILSGLFLGIGLHGYTPIRILPLLVVVAVGLYLLHRQSRGLRRQTLWSLGVLTLVALIVFLPLARFALENPDLFSFRSLSRLGSVERPLPAPAGEIFLKNLWNAMTMFAWDDGEIWVTSVTHRPALDIVSAVLFYTGGLLLLIRYIRNRHWLDIFLLLSVPILLLPSILSLAFPAENPSLNRMSGAIVPVFLIVAISLDGLMSSLEKKLDPMRGPRLAWGMAVVLFLLALLQNYNLVFDEYYQVYRQSAWNTSEMGKVIQQFSRSVGSPDTAWVIAYPHWVDTRLVGINAGYPTKDYAIWSDKLAETIGDPRAKLFLVKPDDAQGLQALRSLYPQGVLQEYISQVEYHNFSMFFVPPQQ